MRFSRLACAIAACCSAAAFAQPLTTSFTYQGELTSAGQPAQGLHDFRFNLFDAAAGGAQVGPSLCADNVSVVDGRFVVSLDFGAVFTGAQRFLAVNVRADTGQSCVVIVGFTPLAGRQALTVAPNAAFSLTSGNATQLNGQPGSFYTNAANLASGTLPDSRLSGNVPQLNLNGTYTGVPNFNGGTSGVSSPFQVDSTTRVNNLNADLLDGLDSSAFALSSHTHDAGAIISGQLADARLSSNIPRFNSSANFLAGGSFSGALGVGTSTPSSLLEIRTADPQLRIRNTNDPGGAMLQNTWGSLQLGLFNPSGAAWNTVPANSYRAMLALDSTGRVGSVTNTGGTPSYRNLLDDGNGNASVAGGFTIDPDNSGNGTLASGALRFGNNSGEAIHSNRNAGVNQWGLDVFTNNLPRFTITQAGDVGIGTQAPTAKLHVNGNISATNLPAIDYSRTDRDARNFDAALLLTQGQNADVENVTISVPSSGYLHITATANVSFGANDIDSIFRMMYLKLEETTGGPAVRLTEVSASAHVSGAGPTASVHGTSVLTISWPIFVNSPGTRSFKINVLNDTTDLCRVWTTSLVVTYYPRSM